MTQVSSFFKTCRPRPPKNLSIYLFEEKTLKQALLYQLSKLSLASFENLMICEKSKNSSLQGQKAGDLNSYHISNTPNSCENMKYIGDKNTHNMCLSSACRSYPALISSSFCPSLSAYVRISICGLAD